MFCTWKHLPPWAQPGKAGSSRVSCSQSHLQGAHAAGAAPVGHRVWYSLPHTTQQTHPCTGCVGTGLMPMPISALGSALPTTSFPLKALRFLEHCWVAQQKLSVFNENLRRRERYKPVKQTNWLSQGSSQKEQAY